MSKSEKFRNPRILTQDESNQIRGKLLIGHASIPEIMSLISHFDLVDQKLRGALEALRTCMPDRVYIWDAGDKIKWAADEPDGDMYFDIVDFEDILEGKEQEAQ